MKHLPQRVGSPYQHIAESAPPRSGYRRRRYRVVFAVATLAMAGCGSTESASVSTTADVVACDAWRIVDGSTFESAGVGNPTLINPSTGNPANPFFRTCGSHYEFDYREPPLPYDASQASVIQPFTRSSTSSGPCMLMT